MKEAREASEYTGNSKYVGNEHNKYRASCHAEHASKFDTIDLVQVWFTPDIVSDVLVVVCYNKHFSFKRVSTLISFLQGTYSLRSHHVYSVDKSSVTNIRYISTQNSKPLEFVIRYLYY